MFIKKTALFFFLFLCLFCAAETSADMEIGIEHLFDDPPEDIVADTVQTDHKKKLEESEKLHFRGSFSAAAGFALGWKNFPLSLQTFQNDFGMSPVALANTHMMLDARPIPAVKIHANIRTEINKDQIGNGWTPFKIESLYGEYNAYDIMYFRIGQYSTKWGVGSIYTPGNLMLNSENGVTFGVTLPTVLNGVRFMVIADKAYAANHQDVTAKELMYAAIADKTFDKTRITLGARFQINDGIKGLLSASTVFGGADIFTDVVLQNSKGLEKDIYVKVLAGFFKEWKKIKFYAEYYYNGANTIAYDHNIGLGLQFNSIFKSIFNFSVLAEHTFSDNSGNVIPMFSFSPLQYVTVNFGIPIIWGKDNTRYMHPKTSESYSRTDVVNDIPRDKRLSLLIAVKCTIPF